MALNVGVLCSANVCRSPMAEVLLRERADSYNVGLAVVSAGMIGTGGRADPAAIRVMDRQGLDLDGHRSVAVGGLDLNSLDLVLTMERDHLREIVVGQPHLWGRTFTIKEYVRRAGAAAPRLIEQPWSAWLDRVGGGRSRTELLGADDVDDVEYPAPPTLRAVGITARELAALSDDVVTQSFCFEAIERPWATPLNT